MFNEDCPTVDFNCPYIGACGECLLDNPMDECDDYYAVYGEEDCEVY